MVAFVRSWLRKRPIIRFLGVLPSFPEFSNITIYLADKQLFILHFFTFESLAEMKRRKKKKDKSAILRQNTVEIYLIYLLSQKLNNYLDVETSYSLGLSLVQIFGKLLLGEIDKLLFLFIC
ncbi:hypothetical protein SapgrDRAFT_0884 [Saprospira grandis DSM 2844]|uniref:Uncharacterized protein n=1 Tax=Saprospira grandis DSM 2844 TaxID=694433 RepID=J0P5D0_9BACT|nr:hypothetical protein SapgrDRAFT_0884 [Saprospira grandis DSM 2844]